MISAASAACVVSAEPEAESLEDDLAVDRTTLPTSATLLMAGQPYAPVVDEPPIAIGGAAPCVIEPRIAVTLGATNVEASFVNDRTELLNKLDLSVAGIPVNVMKLAGATGSARLAVETKFRAGSIHLLLQAKGAFESEVTSFGGEVPSLRADRVPACGWGYVRKAYHRLAAVVVVTIEAADEESMISAGGGVAAGPVEAKAALENILRRGSYNISVRSEADNIEGLAPAPLGSIAQFSSTPESSGEVLARLGNALDWLGGAQEVIARRIRDVHADPSRAAAPTVKVDFSYYPGLTSAERETLARAFDHLVALRAAYETTDARTAAWQEFADARRSGLGHVYNVPGRPAATVDELAGRAQTITSELAAHRGELEAALMRCEDAVLNRVDAAPISSNSALVGAVAQHCRTLAEPSWSADYDATYGLRRVAARSMDTRHYDEWRDDMCPHGQRLATAEEAPLLAPWSHAVGSHGAEGIWIERQSWFHQPRWIKAGKVENIGWFTAPKGLTLCFASGAGVVR